MVIDTDGSAFITKAEFDSLKNNFQAQIDNYNTSIDSKIDGSIAAYLAGVKVSNTESVQMPTSQRVFKTLDSVNFPQTWDNVQIDLLFIQTLMNKWRDPYLYPWILFLSYSQNNKSNKGKNYVATCIGNIAEDAYGVLKGYSKNYVDYFNIMLVNGGMNNIGSSRDLYKNWESTEIFHGDVWGHDFWTGTGTHDTILGKHYDKCKMGLHLFSTHEPAYYAEKTEITIDRSANSRTMGDYYFTDHYNRTNETITYTIQSDKLVMVLGSNYKYPVQYDNQWSLGKSASNYKKYDVDYIKAGDKNQTWTGWLHEGKSYGDTTTPAPPSSSVYNTWTVNDANTYWPGFYSEPKLRLTDYYVDSDWNVNYQFYTDNAHAYFSSSDDYTTYDDRALTEEYNEGNWVNEIRNKWGANAIYTDSGKRYYKLGKGLILCKIDKPGKLSLGVTAKSDDVYFYVYNKPSSRTEAGLPALAGSDSSKGNGVLLTKNTQKLIEYNVDPGIYFFRFGTYTGDWTDLAGGAKIEFDEKLSLEVAN